GERPKGQGAKAIRAGYSGRAATPEGDVSHLAEGRSGGATARRHRLCRRRQELSSERTRDLRRHRRKQDEAEGGSGDERRRDKDASDDEVTRWQEDESVDQTADPTAEAARLLAPVAARSRDVAGEFGGLNRPPLGTLAPA